MRMLVSLLVVAVLVLGYVVYRQSSIMRDQEKALTGLRAQIAAIKPESIRNLLEYQEKCAEQARKAFKDIGYKSNDMAGYENHYNAKLNKCFIMVQDTDATHAPTIWTNKSLFDAYEGKSYAQYSWHTVKGKKYWEVPPFVCKVVLPSGAEHSCKSDDEFEELVKPYLENR